MLMVLNALEAIEEKLEAAEKAAQTYGTYEDLFKAPEEPGQEKEIALDDEEEEYDEGSLWGIKFVEVGPVILKKFRCLDELGSGVCYCSAIGRLVHDDLSNCF